MSQQSSISIIVVGNKKRRLPLTSSTRDFTSRFKRKPSGLALPACEYFPSLLLYFLFFFARIAVDWNSLIGSLPLISLLDSIETNQKSNIFTTLSVEGVFLLYHIIFIIRETRTCSWNAGKNREGGIQWVTNTRNQRKEQGMRDFDVVWNRKTFCSFKGTISCCTQFMHFPSPMFSTKIYLVFSISGLMLLLSKRIRSQCSLCGY